MSQAVHVQTRQHWPIATEPQPLETLEETKSTSLANTLLAIEQRHGTLYMLEMSRYLIEKWDLRCDRLHAQSDDTLKLVHKLLDR
jgi:hypothetical protein